MNPAIKGTPKSTGGRHSVPPPPQLPFFSAAEMPTARSCRPRLGLRHLIDKIDQHRATCQGDRTLDLPEITSFRQFLLEHARVKVGSGYAPYTFAGREALAEIVATIDGILGHKPVAGADPSDGQRDVASNNIPDWRPGQRDVAPIPSPDWWPGQREKIIQQPVAAADHRLGTPSTFDDSTGSNVTLADASLAICGGAQFGKTVLMLNLLAYLVAVEFRNLGYYLPDDDLVAGVVDGKLRPDVLDQIPWLARMLEVGRTLSPTGRAVNRKGAMLCTDGQRTALAWMRGMGKIPTSFSMDVVIQDEKDDIPEARAKFLAGRMTASDLRFSLVIGTQRYHGAGQNKEFEDGSQHVGLLCPIRERTDKRSPDAKRGRAGSPLPAAQNRQLTLGCPTCRHGLNPEEHWPGIVRLAVNGTPSPNDPKLSLEGNFAPTCGGRQDLAVGLSAAAEDQPATAAEQKLRPPSYYLACPDCGAELDRTNARFVARRPERIAARRWSYRLSQLLIPAISLEQIVRAYRGAVRDPEKMIAFTTDRLALPKSTQQQLTPGILDRARQVAPYSIPEQSEGVPLAPVGATRFAGLDTGDRCWLVIIEQRDAAPHHPIAADVPGSGIYRLIWAEEISAERTRARVAEVLTQLGVQTLLVDAGPLRDLARDLCFALNPLPAAPTNYADTQRIEFGAGMVWDGASHHWSGLRAAAVEFTQRPGAGLRHKLARTQDGWVYPLLAANREETIQRAINDFLTPEEGVVEVINPTENARTEPALLLPQKTSPILTTLDAHLLTGSRREPTPDGRSQRFLGQCDNHLLLALAYARLAAQLATRDQARRQQQAPVSFRAVAHPAAHAQHQRQTRRILG